MGKVLHVVADGAPGGGTTAVLGLCKDLMGGGWSPALVTQQASYGDRAGRSLGIETHGLDFFRSRFDPSVPHKLAEVIDAVAPDLIHVHGGRSANPFCSRRLRGLAIPVVYTVHGYHFPNKPWPLRMVFWAAERRISKRVDHTVFVSKNDQAIARRWRLAGTGAGASSVIYNGIDPVELDTIPQKPVEYDLAFVARMHLQKNPRFAVDVAAELAGDGVRMIMVGGGELETDVRAYAALRGVADRIAFAGALSRPEALAALTSARIYLLPSLWEGLPIGPIEAMYYRRPIVASRVSGTDEVVEDGVTGFLIDEFNPRLYAQAVRRLLRDHALQREMGDAGRRRVQSLFLRSASTATYQTVYQRLPSA